MAAPRNSQSIQLVWFRSDLRTGDHPGLTAAVASGQPVLGLFLWPERWFATGPLGIRRTGPWRARALRDAVTELREALHDLRIPLISRIGAPGPVASELAAALAHSGYTKLTLHLQYEAYPEELRDADALLAGLRGAGLDLNQELHDCQMMYDPASLPFPPEEMPDLYTDFRKAVEKRGHVPAPLPAPAAVDIGIPAGPWQEPGWQQLPSVSELSGEEERQPDPRTALPTGFGEQAAWERVKGWIWDGDNLRRYKETRNGLVGDAYSSKFSAYLALGTISARAIAMEVGRYEQERVRNQSTYWLLFELIWRDYYVYLARKYGSRLYQLAGPMRRSRRWKRDEQLFRRWCRGETGEPFVDAGMRELDATGYTSNRARQVVASFLSKDLRLPWTWGAAWFENRLVDYDPGSNWGNWAYVAGVGTDPRSDRRFNPVVQAERYDPDAEFRELWASAG